MGIASVASFPRNEMGQSLITGQPFSVETYDEVDDAPELTPTLMQKLETRHQEYQAAHSSGFLSSFGSFFSKVGGFIKDVATKAIDVVEKAVVELSPLKILNRIVQKLPLPEGFKKVIDKAEGFVSGFMKSGYETAKSLLKPSTWKNPAFWRDVVAPAVMNFIPGIGPVVSNVYKYGMAAYKGIQAITAVAKGKFADAISLGIDSVSGFSSKAGAFLENAKQKVGDAIRKVTAPIGEWIDKGSALYQKGTSILKDWGIFG